MISKNQLLKSDFYDRATVLVARDLIGMVLVRNLNETRISGIITETEAYVGETDLGCHAKAGLTNRTKVMYGEPGHAYVYFTYGNHWMLNAVTEGVGFPAAVLLRAIHPIEGIEIIHANRNGRDTKGPGKLTQAMEITKKFNSIDLCSTEAGLWIEQGIAIPDENVTIAPRVGLYTVPEPWKSKPWNFKVKEIRQ